MSLDKEASAQKQPRNWMGKQTNKQKQATRFIKITIRMIYHQPEEIDLI